MERAPEWRERCCQFNRAADALDRAGCACPYPAPHVGYRPLDEAHRQAQEVSLPGGTWWRGRTCPGAVVQEDPLVQLVQRTYLPLQLWHQCPFPGDWAAQPARWSLAIQIFRAAVAAADREER